jgi:hypothetical protein
MLCLWLLACRYTVFFPPDLWGTEDSADTGAATVPTEAS